MDWNAPPPPDSDIPLILARLIPQAQQPDGEGRRTAIEKIYELAFKVGPKAAGAIPVLIGALADEDAKVGESALWALKYCAPESIPDVTACLADARAIVRERAASSLGNMGEQAAVAAPPLRALLADPVEPVRAQAAWALGVARDTDKETVRAILTLAEHGTTSDRRAAFHALGNLGTAEEPADLTPYRSMIEAALDDPDADVRWSALYASQGVRAEVTERVARLTRQLANDSAEHVQEACLHQLRDVAKFVNLSGHAGLLWPFLQGGSLAASNACAILETMKPPPPEVVTALIAALENDNAVVYAAAALWRMTGDPAPVLPALARAFDTEGESICDLVCEMGAAALPIVPQLVAALASEDWDLQWAAADALGAVAAATPEVVPPLLAALEHPSPIVRSASARALARAGAAAVPALTEILGSADPRGALAAMALGKMEQCPSPALPALRKGMSAGEQPLAGCCAIALAAHTADPACVPHLIEAALTGDPSSPREAAIQALQELGPAAVQATAALEALASDEDEDIAVAAQEALEAIGGWTH